MTLLPPLQFAVLMLAAREPTSGKLIRKGLREQFDLTQSGPAFYQLMARLESDKLIEGWYEYETVGTQPIKERWYRTTAAGVKAIRKTKVFYK